jgi:hypothetical protein
MNKYEIIKMQESDQKMSQSQKMRLLTTIMSK